MMRGLLLALALVGCTKATPPQSAPPQPPPAAIAPPAPTPPAAKAATVTLSAITLADDCGGAAPTGLPSAANDPAPKGKRDAAADTSLYADRSAARMSMKQRCEQTSMQLSIVAGDAASIKVKSVELFDESGKSLGMLTPSKPTKWSETSSTYEAWDEALAKDSTSNVSYVLSQPNWASIGNRYNKTFTLKTVVTVGGVDAPAEKSVTLTAPASLPPGVKT